MSRQNDCSTCIYFEVRGERVIHLDQDKDGKNIKGAVVTRPEYFCSIRHISLFNLKKFFCNHYIHF